MSRNKIIDNKFEQAQWRFYKARMKSASAILKELAAVKTINKFEMEKLIRKARNYLHPSIMEVDSYG
jgi:hypothetical protein